MSDALHALLCVYCLPLARVQAIAVLKAIESGWVHPTLNQVNSIEEVAGIDTVPNEKKQHAVSKQTRRCMCSAMCIGPTLDLSCSLGVPPFDVASGDHAWLNA